MPGCSGRRPPYARGPAASRPRPGPADAWPTPSGRVARKNTSDASGRRRSSRAAAGPLCPSATKIVSPRPRPNPDKTSSQSRATWASGTTGSKWNRDQGSSSGGRRMAKHWPAAKVRIGKPRSSSITAGTCPTGRSRQSSVPTWTKPQAPSTGNRDAQSAGTLAVTNNPSRSLARAALSGRVRTSGSSSANVARASRK